MTNPYSEQHDNSAPIGERFNRLTVIGLAGHYRSGTKIYLCKCDCGGKTRTSLNHLRRGDIKSCGCLRTESIKKIAKKNKVQMQGQRFGRLVVEKEAGRTRNGTVQWICQCDCGRKVTVAGHSLRRPNGTQSCGCLISEMITNRNKKTKKTDGALNTTHQDANEQKAPNSISL